MERVVQVFESADMKKGAKGDGSLELAEFLEAIVKLAFARENPSFGSDGSTEVPKPLPGCLETILKDNLLLNAKRDALAEVKAALTTDGPTKQVLAARRHHPPDRVRALLHRRARRTLRHVVLRMPAVCPDSPVHPRLRHDVHGRVVGLVVEPAAGVKNHAVHRRTHEDSSV